MAVGLVVFGLLATPARAAHNQPVAGLDGTTRSNIFDNTQATLDAGDPIIGYVVQRQPKASDLTHIEVRVHLQGAAPNCNFVIQLVLTDTDPKGGLEPGEGHSGAINFIGAGMTTNGVGNGTSGAILVDVTKAAIAGESAAGALTYGHIDVEGVACAGVVDNQYGSDPDRVKGHNAAEIHWLQPA